jgi:NAD(P)-dependent dehydrogenase (short-subunit alcohol dehydrogenase family)
LPGQRVAMITGASSGFGRITAETLATAGWLVYAGVRDASGRNAKEANQLHEAGIVVVELDVTDDASVDAAAMHVLGDVGAVDGLMNNAGSGYFGITEAFTPAAVERQFAVNVLGPLRVNRAFLPSMRDRRRGLIVYVSSTLGRSVLPFSGPYAATKWALEAFAEASSYELAPFRIDVAILEPGAFPTQIFSKFVGADDAVRVGEYGDIVKYAERLTSAFDQEMVGRDPVAIADAVLNLVKLPPGTVPLRVPIPGNEGMDRNNFAAAAYQQKLLADYGLINMRLDGK